MKLKLLLLALLSGLTHIAIGAELGQPDGAPVRLGDSVEQVKKALGTTLDPEKDDRTSVLPSSVSLPLTTSIYLKTRGIRVFFNSENKVKIVHMQPPFKGEIQGVKIGDTKEKIIEKLGEPTKKTKAGSRDKTYTYYTDDITSLGFLISADNTVEAIVIAK